ncbi:anthranilate phosphoribosyltransferase [Salipaludibacillus agaradhaerens]|uniref:anthranilate phosphoribosyltransferase n=1 Tax=Salipaludibacillus agaradhaerens TaxID=76935 RepID=UPI0009963B3F|nr:anthranilate phosphoribosyltransferase [Salipaludibacillus agaradhaerens]
MSRALERIMSTEPLTEDEAKQLVIAMMEGQLNNEEMAGILSVLQYRGETVDELVGFAKGMQEKGKKISLPYDVLDTCGTGGDGKGTFNISTAVAILLSSIGVKVAKHGNRSVSSTTGSADVLTALGVPFQETEQEVSRMLQKHHLAFLFAPIYHSAMKNVAPVRKQLGMKTIFNLLGPLTNPANAPCRIIGVYDHVVAKKMAYASQRLGIKRALFVCGEDGLDELTVQGKSYIIEVNGDHIHEFIVTPEDVGLKTEAIDKALVSSPAESATLIKKLFAEKGAQAAENLLLLNAGAALYVQGRAVTIKDGVKEAKKALGTHVLNHLAALQSEREEVTTL